MLEVIRASRGVQLFLQMVLAYSKCQSAHERFIQVCQVYSLYSCHEA